MAEIQWCTRNDSEAPLKGSGLSGLDHRNWKLSSRKTNKQGENIEPVCASSIKGVLDADYNERTGIWSVNAYRHNFAVLRGEEEEAPAPPEPAVPGGPSLRRSERRITKRKAVDQDADADSDTGSVYGEVSRALQHNTVPPPNKRSCLPLHKSCIRRPQGQSICWL